jgi:hypothetical protein
MAKATTVKATKAKKRVKAISLPLRGDMEGPCSKLDQELATLAGQLAPLLALLANPPTATSQLTISTTGVLSWDLP